MAPSSYSCWPGPACLPWVIKTTRLHPFDPQPPALSLVPGSAQAMRNEGMTCLLTWSSPRPESRQSTALTTPLPCATYCLE